MTITPAESALISAWWRIFRNQRLVVKSVILTAMEGGNETSDLRLALLEVVPSDYPGAISPHKLGRWLARSGSSPSGSYVFVDRGVADGGRTWQLVPVSNHQSEEEQSLPDGFLDAVAG